MSSLKVQVNKINGSRGSRANSKGLSWPKNSILNNFDVVSEGVNNLGGASTNSHCFGNGGLIGKFAYIFGNRKEQKLK